MELLLLLTAGCSFTHALKLAATVDVCRQPAKSVLIVFQKGLLFPDAENDEL